MTLRSLVISSLFTALAAGCGSKVTRDNPFDAKAPPSLQAKARLAGAVVLEARATHGGASVTVREVSGGDAALTYDATSADDGTFAVEVPGGTYNVEIAHPGYLGVFLNNVTVQPGETRDLGLNRLTIARGALDGAVILDDGQAPTGTTVSLVPLTIPGGRTVTVLAGPDGSYFSDGLAAGDYLVRAEKNAYAPAYTPGGITVTVNAVVSAPTLRLYPAAAIVRVERNSAFVRYVNDRAVSVVLLPFVEFLSDMRVSEDPTFADPRWDVDYRTFNTPVDFTLADQDGERVIAAQFRDSLGLESDAFFGAVILDRAAPEVLTFTINDGAAFLTVADGVGEASLSFTGRDTLSGIDAFRVTLAADFTDEPFQPLDSVSSGVTHFFDTPLGDENGLKTVRLQLRDRAGNLSTPAVATIMRDRLPPQLGTPAILIDPSLLTPGGAVRTLDVSLLFDVTGDRPDEPMFVAVANGQGLDASATFVPLHSPFSHRLADGPDNLSREVCALFKDGAGLLTEQQCLTVVVDRTGGLTGRVELEGLTDHSGVLVEIGLPADPSLTLPTDFTDPSGRFDLAGVPAGAGYALRFSRDGYLAQVDWDVLVVAGVAQDRGTLTLRLPRASITGTVTLVDKGTGQHAGIVIADASSATATVTNPNGSFLLADVPLNQTYNLSARFPGYLALSFAPIAPDDLTPGETHELGTWQLQKQEGDFNICAGSDTSALPCPAIAFSQSRTVRLGVQSTLTFWRFGLDSTFAAGADPFVPFDNSAIHLFTFAPAVPDGQKTVYAQFSADGVTADGPPVAGVVTLDTTPPVPAAPGAVILDPDDNDIGAVTSNHPSGVVTVQLAATDAYAGVARVRLRNTTSATPPVDFSGVTAVPYFTRLTHTLNTAVQGEQWVWAQFCDAVDNCTSGAAVVGDAIIYDTVPPNATSGVGLRVYDSDTDTGVDPDGDTVTDSPFVVLAIDTGDAVAVRFGNTQTLGGAAFVAVNPGQTIEFQHILPFGDGAKTVYAQFVDTAGNASPLSPNPHSFTITLDTVPPTSTSLTIAEGLYTNQDGVNLTMIAFEATQVQVHVGDAEDFSAAAWQAFPGTAPSWQATIPWAFPAPPHDGNYNVYVRFRDQVGNLTATLSRSVIRDTVAPEYASVSVLEGDHCASQLVNLVLFAVGASDMILRVYDVTDPGNPVLVRQVAQSYAPATSILLGATPGPYRVDAEFVDLADNHAAVASATVTYDSVPPTIDSFTIAESPYTTSTSVTLQIAATGAAYMKIANSSTFTGAAWEPIADSRAWTLQPTDGLRRIYLLVKDEAGNEPSAGYAEASTTLDRQAPQSLTVSVAAGADYVTTNLVAVTLSATDTNGVTQVMLANDAAFSNGVWESYTATPMVRANWALTSGDGPKTVFARFRDAAGNVGEKADSVIVDTEPPGTTVAMANDAVAVTSPLAVPVTLSASSDVVKMKLVEGSGGDCTPSTITVDYNSSATFNFSGTPPDGPLALTACVKDNAGLVGAAEDTVLLDRVPPTASLLINGTTGGYTNNPNVTLTITADDATSGVDAIRIANQQDMTGVTWQAYSSTRSWTIPTSGPNPKTVWLEVRDRAGLVRTNVNATVTLITTPPTGTISVVEGGASPCINDYCRDTAIQVTLTRGDANAVLMAFGPGFLDCGAATYQPYAAGPHALTLPAGDGLKNISLCLKDTAGNTATATTAVTLDTRDPVGTLLVNGGEAYTINNVVTLTINTDSDVVQMKIGDGTSVDCTTGTYVSFSAAPSHTLPASEGLRTVQVCVRDSAQRWAKLSDTVFLDLAPPAPTDGGGWSGIVINDGDTLTTSTLVTLSLSAGDGASGSGVTQMKISDGASCTGGIWQGFGPSASWIIEAGDNVAREVSVQFRDAAGRASACASDSITIDTVDPAVTFFAIDGDGADPEYTADASVTITGLTYVGNCEHIEVSEDPTFITGVTSFPCAQSWPASYTLVDYAPDGSRDGVKEILARVVDPAGRASPAARDQVILDTGGPTEAAVIVNNGDPNTNDRSLTVQFIAAGATQMKVTANADCSGGSWEAFVSVKTVTVPDPGGPATLHVSAEYRDDAGNGEGTCYTDTIAYDPSWSGSGAIAIVVLQGTGGYTTSTEVRLDLTASETASAQMKLSNGQNCSGGTWEPFAALKQPWSLASAGEGTAYVSVRYMDAAGNTSDCYVDSVPIDTVPPSGLSVVIDGGAEFTTSTVPTVTLAVAASGMNEVMVSEDPTFGGGETWRSPAAINPFTLTAGNGTKTVYVKFRDAAGNVAPALASDNIVLDNVPPAGSVVVDGGATFSTSASGYVTLNLSASDAGSGLLNMQFCVVSCATPANWLTAVPYAPTYPSLQLDSPTAVNDAVRTVQARFIDRAGNVSTAASDTIRLDNVTPVPGGTPILIAAGASYTSSQTVALTLSASGASEMQLSNGQGCAGGGAWLSYATNVAAWPLDGPGDNVLKYVSVRFRDAAGNTTACAEDSIYVDTEPPVAQYVTIENGARYANGNTLNLAIAYSGTPQWMYIASSEAGLAGATPRAPSGSATYDATAEPEGLLRLFVRFRDAAGNYSNVVLDDVVRDRTPPTGTVSIDAGATWSRASDALVTLNLAASDALAEITRMDLRNGTSGGWTNLPFTQVYTGWLIGTTYPPGEDDATKTVQVRFIDAAGNVSTERSDTIRLDNVPPGSPSLTIYDSAGGTSSTTSTRVRLGLSASGNPSTMRIANNNSCTGGITYTYTTSLYWTLDTTGDNVTADVSVMFYDSAGNASACQTDAITVDTVAPILASVTLDGRFNNVGTQIGLDSADTRDCYVRVAALSVNGTYSQIQFSMSYTFGTVFQTLAAGATLPYNGLAIPAADCGTDGQKTIYARAIDTAGNVSSYIATPMRVDTVAPTPDALKVNDGAKYTSSLDLQNRIGKPYDAGGIEELRFHNTSTNACTTAPAYTFAGPGTAYDWTYNGTTGAGTKTVWLCVIDGAGNTASTSDTIIYDNTPPGSVTIAVDVPGTDYTGGTASGLTCTGGTPANPHWVNTTSPYFLLSAADTYSLASEMQMKIVEDVGLNGFGAADFDGVPWQAYATGSRATITAGDGPKLVTLRVKDAVELTADAATPVCVTLDTAPPEAVTLAIDQGAFTANTTVDATLTAVDYQSSSTGMLMCFASGSHLQASGIRNGVGTVIGSKSTDPTCSTTSNWYAYDPDLRLVLTTGSGAKRLVLYVKDAANNKQPVPAEATVYLDETNPTAPVLNVVQPSNKSAELFWTAGSDAESGVKEYQVRYRTVQPVAGAYQYLTVDGTATSATVTGLDNRTRYEFAVATVDNAARLSSYSATKATTVGWQRSTVAYSSSDTLIPFGIQEKDGVIYLGYAQHQSVWSQSITTLHMAVSRTGGSTWQSFTVDSDRVFTRETAAMYVTMAGVVVVSMDLDNAVAAWLSVDEGTSWQKTVIDANAPYGLSGFSLTREGGALVAMYERSTDSNTYIARSYDSGLSWYTGTNTYTDTSLPDSLGVCNTQFKLAWYRLHGNTLYLMYSSDLGSSSFTDTDPASVTSVRRAAIACNDPVNISPNDGKAYVVYTSTGSMLYLRENDFNGSLYWDSTAVTLRASGVDTINRPAVYVGGTAASEKIFVAYRDTSGNVVVGESSDPDLDTAYTWVTADMSTNVGLFLTMNGTAEGSPLLAYTDESGHQLFVLRSALPAPETRPTISDAGAILSWFPVPGAENYQVSTPSTTVITPDTSFNATAADRYTAVGLDADGQAGEPGMTWDMAPFVYGTVRNISMSGTIRSSTGALYTNGTTVLSTIPLGARATYGTAVTDCDSYDDICLYRSVNSGDTVVGALVRDMTLPPTAKHMAVGDNGAGLLRVHFVYTDDETPAPIGPDLEYARADFDPNTGTYGTLSAFTYVNDLDNDDPAGGNPAYVVGHQAQISVSGAYVLAAWVNQVSGAYQVRYKYSTDYGVTWSALKYAENSTDLGYQPDSLTIVYHSAATTMFAWINNGSAVRFAYTGNFTAATPSWSAYALGGSGHDANFVRGGRYQDNWVIPYIGVASSTETQDSVYVFVGGENATSAGGNSWAAIHLDLESAIAGSLDLAIDATGVYITYATSRTLLGLTTRNLKLAYCKQECTGRDNWVISTVLVDTDTATNDYRGATLAKDPGTHNLFIGATRDTTGTDNYILEKRGRLWRQN